MEAANEPPLRSELLGAGQMEQHAREVAAAHRLGHREAPDRLLARLDDNERILVGACGLLTEALAAERRIAPAGEWLLDNFYLIEEQIRTARRHLPKGYSRGLPRLGDGPSAGLPRIYDLALEAISHGDGRSDPEALLGVVAAYQTVTVLQLGELWAFPIMLRLALIENLRRVAARMVAGRIARNRADHWADRMAEVAEKDPKSLILATADMARSDPPLVSSFVAEFARRLQGKNAALPLTWLEQRLAESGLTIERLVQAENQEQAGDQVSIANSIGSLRALGAKDWRAFVEAASVVEETLRRDPGGIYGSMDFATRDRYRHVVERISKQSPLTEEEVARQAVERAEDASSEARAGRDDPAAHVGFHLIGGGLPALERWAGVRRSGPEALRCLAARVPLAVYLGSILLTAAALSAIAVVSTGGAPWPLLALVGVLSALGASHLAVGLVNGVATLSARPALVPRLDFSEGIPPKARTLVVIPTMLTSARGLEKLIEALEVRFLANRDERLHFALLTDFRDADEETAPGDAPLLALARGAIEALNERYGGAGGEAFFLFHRPRRWNDRERLWMGYERKRGKLAELNSLLRGGGEHRFALVVGQTAVLQDVKYVITLDTDTQLPRDAARRLAGAMAHPLNRPRYDQGGERVCEGYGILQPRVGESLPGATRSRYARLCGGEAGIDPYTRAVSDVYQDLFREGSFIGKGIYDVDAFERAVGGRFPENRILSHDLVEGCYARAGLLSDVELYEEHPSRYAADVARRHRWIRGDWQIARWASPWVPGADGRRRANPLSLLSRWKILDNLRRSLVPGALLLLLLLGWTLLPRPGFWTLAVLGSVVIPSWLASLLGLLRKPQDVPVRQHLGGVARSAGRHSAQAAFGLACLPYEAFFSLDAVLRTAGRLLTRRRLLEWSPSADTAAGRAGSGGFAAELRAMWIGPFLAAAAALHLALVRPATLAVAGPLLVLWFASPAAAWWLSRPLPRRPARLTADQAVFLRSLARKTWGYFETFVGTRDHWLPPDNVQEYPATEVAHRTSPTNMGLALLANLSACDFGYLPAGKLLERTARAFATMEALERHRGHFYNWYDTETLRPLPPLYVSSVDSGNLAGHLLTLRQGLLELGGRRILSARFLEGLADTLAVLGERLGGDGRVRLAPLERQLADALASSPTTLSGARTVLERLMARSAALEGSLPAPAAPWAEAFGRQCGEALEELSWLAPWCSQPTRCAPEGESGDAVASGRIPTLRELAALGTDAEDDFGRLVLEGSLRARERLAEIEGLAEAAGRLACAEFGFLFDPERKLLAVGYNVDECRRDPSFYDLLASEARLATFVGIARGELPQESWFALGRLLTSSGGEPTLLSWSGSMFEYLMPLLVMPTYEGTLLDQTDRAAVRRQIAYGRERGVPWGISESGYNAVDVGLRYQYRAFGVPGLGLKRGLAEDLVVAPYASALALMVAPEEACRNLERLAREGTEGAYGLYEAVDYTPSRLPRGHANAIIRSFMSHHQGMSLLSLAYLLLDRPMQRRFAADPALQATALLLQERIPKPTAPYRHVNELAASRQGADAPGGAVRVFDTPHTASPEVQLLSNGRYHVMVTNAGGGYSRWKDLAVTRWREDATRDPWGTFCYLRDVTSGRFWSGAHQPTLKPSESYEAVFSEAKVEFRVRKDGLEAHTEIAVSPEDDVELRRLTLTNRSRVRRTIEVTSYAEVVLAPPAAEALHPAFSNLFVQTELLRDRDAVLCTRRPRSAGEPTPWLFHLLAVHGAELGECSYETDRSRFIGRGNTTEGPDALTGPPDANAGALSGSEGSVLDPIVAIRRRVTLEPEGSATVSLVWGVADTREACLELVGKYQDPRLAERVAELAWAHGQVVLRQLDATEADAQLFGRLAGAVLFGDRALRADPGVLGSNRRGQPGLWGYSISGDLPIVLLQIADPANLELARQLIQAHAYWRLKGLAVDLMIWTEDHAGYRQVLHEQILGLVVAGDANATDRPGGVFVRPGDQIPAEDRLLLQTVARAILTDRRGSLADQLGGRSAPAPGTPRPKRTAGPARRAEPPSTWLRPDLLFYNGLGGFTPDGHEYIITTAPGRVTPAPWVNVLANPHFGTVVSESGSAYTWSENAHEFRLTPWSNDPVSDGTGEAFYLRDEESGRFWSPTPLPSRGGPRYVTRHGFGYTVFEHEEGGVRSELWVYVALDAAVKFAVLKLRNDSSRPRRLSVTGYAEWVLGDLRPKTAPYVATELDPETGALFARNPYSADFPDRVAFFDASEPVRTVSGDRCEFLGRNGTLGNPAALTRERLSGRLGPGLDPCAAVQLPFELAGGEERELVFVLGVGRDAEDARTLVKRFRSTDAARAALEEVWHHWNRTLEAVQVKTPDPALDVLANGWLVYQTLACRLWARSGAYQSGGAFGFRDQLQDAMALVHAAPHVLRDQLLLCASHQFREGDVQHWWHPPTSRGVRTHCSDDLLWLPLAACRYVQATADHGVLEVVVPFLDGREVPAHEDSYYDLPQLSGDSGTLYEHCVRAIRRALRFGEHGLPLIGSGDWNDGMNRVGEGGKGESVWLGFFLYDVLTRFGALARRSADPSFAELCGREAAALRGRIEEHGWDGAWYRRAYFDDGTPLGSAGNDECRIDSIAQSWSVLSGAGSPDRSRCAMEALDRNLVRRDASLIQLLDPPFDRSPLEPGYIKGYVPGVRENGGQYTHAAIWAAMAFAELGDGPRAWELTSLVNPVNHGSSAAGAAVYKVEPYVAAADVYAVSPHTGRGGWSWYTGSAGWLYRLVLESLLGVRLEGDRLAFTPCVPPTWEGFTVVYRYRETVFRVAVQFADGAASRVTLDGAEQPGSSIPLVDDGGEHRVEVSVGTQPSTREEEHVDGRQGRQEG